MQHLFSSYNWSELLNGLKVNNQTITNWLESHLLNIVLILAISWALRQFGVKILVKIISHSVRRGTTPSDSERKKRVKTLQVLVKAVLNVVIWIIAILMIIDEIGIDTKPLLASAGVLGVALGFGAQSVIKDFMSGLFIISENQYRVGDVVELNNVSGTVESITVRTTVLRDLNGNVHHIPNGTITLTSNMTKDYGNINLDILVGYDTDIDQLEKIIDNIGTTLSKSSEYKSKILEAPHFVRIDTFAENGMVIKILGRVAPSKQWDINGELRRRLKKAFDQNGIVMPYQHIVLHQAPPITTKQTSKKIATTKKSSVGK